MAAQYGIIGYPLEHSFSPAWFAEKFAREGIAANYKAYPLEHIEVIDDLLENYPLKGLNVTIPYKKSVIEHLDEMDAAAAEIGAVNCVDIRNKERKGYNTDVIGFEKSLLPLLKSHHTKALVLGTGGSSRAVNYVLDKLCIARTSVSRYDYENSITYADLTAEIVDVHKLIINTTPLGMWPNIDEAPAIPYGALGSEHILYDLIYNPEETKFLRLGKEQGATIKNGYEMLVLQAEASWQIWNRA
ncbi:MAG TPA: shikimate dehydrogenase [Flavipsychrobacter sp.]|nr:shikimate dehydrogenase [Flavipsychrobacter sp.]